MGYMRRAAERESKAEWDKVDAKAGGRMCLDCETPLDATLWQTGPRRCEPCERVSRDKAVAAARAVFPVDLVFFRATPHPWGEWLVRFEARSLPPPSQSTYKIKSPEAIRELIGRTATRLTSEDRSLLEIAILRGQGRLTLSLTGDQMQALDRRKGF
jgi:hypothetical protein